MVIVVVLSEGVLVCLVGLDEEVFCINCCRETDAEEEASCHFHLSFPPMIPVPSEGVLLNPEAVAENRGLDPAPSFL
jgi:hypothetical protein